MRPVSPEELDMVDWRGRWIDDEDEDGFGDDDEDEDRQMEEFDPVRGSGLIINKLFNICYRTTETTTKMRRRKKKRKTKKI
jgi:hypothetical protein